ncbi:MAG: ParB/RepB/Spo0J family partition protein [Nostocaceae cyanobacterium]|nr:ParB/RepB/Spo0J family partition protein [Nostocaceae cyanobacterium]
MSVKRRELKDFVFDNAESPMAEPTGTVALSAIVLPSHQPRGYFDSGKMEQLIQSVKEHGILENLLVRPLSGQEGRYELVAGERRYRAAVAVGLVEVPVSIRELTQEQAFAIALVENLQREDLNPVEETEGIVQLLALRLDCPQEQAILLLYRMQNDITRMTNNVISQPEAESVKTVFAELGMMGWESFVSNRLPLLKLPEDILEVLRQGQIEYTKALAISRVKDLQARQQLLQEAIATGLSLAQIKERVKSLSNPLLKKPANVLKDRISEVLVRAQKTKIWTNPQKQKSLEKLLAQMEKLMEED